jgi:hypothetical protein
MGVYCRFHPKDLAVADAWVSLVESPCSWTLGEKLEGEAGSHAVTNDQGIRAVAKPSVAHNDGVPRAAHEKIASDLAHHIDVPVPAVCLWTDPNTSRHYSVSAWAFDECLSWSGASKLNLLTATFLHEARPIISVGAVFHTWIGNSDPNGENVLIDVKAPANLPGIAFIDHAFSMSRMWQGETETLQEAGTDYCGQMSLLPGPMAEVISRIQSLDSKVIEEIVSRIPDYYLSSGRRRLIIANLMRRRGELAGVFGVI